MSEWHKGTIGDLLMLQRGIDLPDAQRTLGPIPIMGSFGVTGYHNVSACSGPGVTVGRSGASIGCVSYTSGDYWPLNTCLYVRDFKGNNPRFCYYFLKCQDLARLNSGSAQPSLNRNFVHPVPALIPGRTEQDAIAALLGSLDDKIELNRRMNETLEAMARAIFKDWFVDFGPTRAKMEGCASYLASDAWALFPDRLDHEGKPAEWELSSIGQEMTVAGGSTPSTKEPTYWDGAHAWATPKDLSGLSAPVLVETERRITDAGLTQIGSGLLPRGTVLLSSRAPIGYVALATMPVAVNQGFIAMTCNGRLSASYALLWAKQNLDLIIQNANGSTFLEISKKSFRPLPVIVPPAEVRQQFDGLAGNLMNRIVANVRENTTLAQTRDLLLPKLMSGEIRIRDAEKVLEAAA